MYIKKKMPFDEHRANYVISMGCEHLFYMFITAKSFDEWAKLYRNLYWALLKNKCPGNPQKMEDMRIISLRVMLTKAPSEVELLEEVIGHSDIRLIEELIPINEDELSTLVYEDKKHFHQCSLF
jgi:hypothetical protein